ncbi:MAG: alpha/beta hydrolase [Anaerolinea sp.]|nr:alpha/beta hydrolase [Anaerolinea sp.]
MRASRLRSGNPGWLTVSTSPCRRRIIRPLETCAEGLALPTFESNGVTINFIQEGVGPDIVLVHGFASSLQGNWRGPGVVDALVASGRRVTALDCRGHGRSSTPHDPAAYGGTKMADDVLNLMDQLGITKADLMGYSMGAGISAQLVTRYPERFRAVIFGGMGDALLSGGRPREGSNAIAEALEAKDSGEITDATAKGFRVFAKSTGADLLALAAVMRSGREGADPGRLRAIQNPVMVIVGEADTLIVSADRLAAAIPGCTYVKVPGDHTTAVTPVYSAAVVEFLAKASPVS